MSHYKSNSHRAGNHSPEQTNIQAAKHVETGSKAEEGYKAGKYYLRTKSTHPRRQFQIGRHAIGPGFTPFELNEAEAKELGTAGPRAWVEIGDATKAKADDKLFKNFDSAKLDKLPL